MPTMPSSSVPKKITDVLDRSSLQGLAEKSDLAGGLAILGNWGLVAACFAALAQWPHPLVFVLVVVLLGGRQLGFAILTHEAAHRTLFRQRVLNDKLADWLCARPIWTDVSRYRGHHMKHHSHTGVEGDPDLSLVRPFPTTRAGLRRKLLRDALGISGVRRIIGLIGMDLGMLEYSVAADPRRLPRNGRVWTDYAAAGLRHFAPVLLSNLLILGVLAYFDAAWVYLAWLLAYLTSFSLFLRIRSIAEHACTESSANPFLNTRSTQANWLARLTVAPFCVNYHVEHHLMASVPFFRLPALHRLLRERGAVRCADGYVQVLRLAGSLAD